MKYPGFEAAGSAVYPKIIGSYEKELEKVFLSAVKRQISTIVDIGSAEGYYANGLAYVLPSSKVYAYDIDERARRLCTRMAQLNRLEERVSVHGSMGNLELGSFPFPASGSFVISDCEGFEKSLFTKESVANLHSTEVLIEVHDLFDLTVSTHLKSVFLDSHDLEVIQSLDDVKKAQTYNYPETEGLDLDLRYRVFAEGRHASMEWYYFTPKRMQ